MDVKQGPDAPLPDDGDALPAPDAVALRLLWPEFAPELPEAIDHESAALAARRARSFRLYLSGKSMREIAEDPEIRSSPSTVCRDVTHVLDGYRLIALQDAARHMARELSRLAYAENELLNAWEQSKRQSTERTTRRGKESAVLEASVKKKQREGNPVYMALYLRCVRDRSVLTGLARKQDFLKDDALPPVKLVAGLDPAELV